MNALLVFIEGRMRLMTMSFSNPATERCSARKISAIPPAARRRRRRYLPNCLGSASTGGPCVLPS